MLRSIIRISGFLLLCCSFQLRAQPNLNGVPIITNYHYDITGGNEQNWCITQDFRGVLYVGNNDKGIMEYDGVEWRIIPVTNDVLVRSLVTGDDGVVYAGLEGDFGRLEPDSTGRLAYRSLVDTSLYIDRDSLSVWKSYFENGKVFFCSIYKAFVFNPEDQSLEIIEYPEETLFSYFVDHRMYLNEFDTKGLVIYENSEFKPVPGGKYFCWKIISGMERFRKDKLLISTYYNGLMILDPQSGAIDQKFISEDLMDELSNAMITYMSIEGEQILLGTFYNGIYILDLEGNVKQIIAKSEELKDRTITHIFSNRRIKGGGPLWISHWKGLSKVETNNPFRKFTEASGFEGLITDIAEFNGELYISTMSGLFRRESSNEGTRFVAMEEVQGEIYDLQVVNPTRRSSFLMVGTNHQIFLVNKNRYVAPLEDYLILPEGTDEDLTLAGRHIIMDPANSSRVYTGFKDIVGLEYYRGKWKVVYHYANLGADIQSLTVDRFGFLWVTTPGSVMRIDVSLSKEATLSVYGQNDGLISLAGNIVFSIPPRHDIKMGTRDGIYLFDYFKERFMPDSAMNAMLPPGQNRIWKIYTDNDGDYWLSFENEYRGWTELLLRRVEEDYEVISEKPFQRLSAAAYVDVFTGDREDGVWFSKSDELYYFDKSFSRSDSLPFNALVRKVIVNGDSILFQGTNFVRGSSGNFQISDQQEAVNIPVLDFKYNNLEFRWAAPYFEQEERLQYSYRLNGFDRRWSSWSEVPYQAFTNLKHGKYTLWVKARNVYDYESEPATYSFVVRRPWYASILAIIAYIILGGMFIYMVIKLYTRRLTRENIRLEGIIQDRTAEIRKQKEELTDSIEYASRIQRALLPSDQLMEKHKLDHFILFRPRDIVSGDFYWLGEKKGKLMIVAADCTGHGVPGAFMSMLGMTFLDEIVINAGITDTARILGSLREHVITSLEQSHEESHDAVKDGMDLAMVSVDLKSGAVQYSGAYNPLYLVRKLNPEEKKLIDSGEELDIPRGSIFDDEHLLIQIRADQMPIGISEKENDFSSTRIKDDGYSYYMFSDGYVDQFGGSKGKKFMSRNFKKMLLELQKYPMAEQGKAMEKVILDWMGDISQIDDILVMGLRLKSN